MYEIVKKHKVSYKIYSGISITLLIVPNTIQNNHEVIEMQ